MPERYYRKVIKIRGEDSPNVVLARRQTARGITPTDERVLRGVLTWGEYQKRRKLWDKVRQIVGLDAEFYEGAEVLMFPPDWLDLAERRAVKLARPYESPNGHPRSRIQKRTAKGLGIDPGEGEASTVWTVVDELGILELVSRKTLDTSVIPEQTKTLAKKWNLDPGKVAFDRGGGGKQHADRMRKMGYEVRTYAFGESPSLDPRRGLVPTREKMELREERYAYRNLRGQMYGQLRDLLDPSYEGADFVFAMPPELAELRRQLALIPLLRDGEGRMYLPPKNRRPGMSPSVKTLEEIIGCSPDEADSLVLAVHVMLHGDKRPVGGVILTEHDYLDEGKEDD